ncbi:hypothetical protein [Rufibacter immobilis]|uniref:hypothetical protein n=1 Tax=Rufibacter immobilis TaxID=1348778 RepID=UPI0035EDC17B
MNHKERMGTIGSQNFSKSTALLAIEPIKKQEYGNLRYGGVQLPEIGPSVGVCFRRTSIKIVIWPRKNVRKHEPLR